MDKGEGGKKDVVDVSRDRFMRSPGGPGEEQNLVDVEGECLSSKIHIHLSPCLHFLCVYLPCFYFVHTSVEETDDRIKRKMLRQGNYLLVIQFENQHKNS